ncbi:HEPN domain-containing protein [Pseudoalteromonas distincta]|uniref:HEPN domain-containing protein n=1 Tax=Pseudoalteromonas distincta TaxID=77608 RepID=UPI00352CB4CA
MSSIKEVLFGEQEKQAEKWVRERLTDQNLTVESEEWQSLLNDYSAYQDYLNDEYEWISEIKWLKENGSVDIYQNFVTELTNIKKLAENSLSEPIPLNENLIIKMCYSYSVTLLEAFLGDTIKALISENNVYLNNALERVDQIRNTKYSLFDLSKSGMDLSGLAVKCVSEVLFHKIDKTMEMYKKVLGCKINIDTSKVKLIIDIRHDIVHRNGYTKENEVIDILPHDLYQAITDIKNLVDKLQKIIANQKLKD